MLAEKFIELEIMLLSGGSGSHVRPILGESASIVLGWGEPCPCAAGARPGAVLHGAGRRGDAKRRREAMTSGTAERPGPGERSGTAERLARVLAAGPRLWVTLVCLELAATVTLLAIQTPPIDLQVYRIGAEALSHGHTLYADLPPVRSGVHLPFIYPPFAAVAFIPLTLPNMVTTQLVFNLVSALAVGVTMYAVFRTLYPRGVLAGAGCPPRQQALKLTVLAMPFALALEPVRGTELFGQVNSVLMAMVAVDCLLLRHHRYRGILVGLAAAVKLTPAAFLLLFVLRRDARGVLGAALGGLGATAIGFAVAPGDSVRYLSSELFDNPMLDKATYASNQGLTGLWARLLATNQPGQDIAWAVSALGVLVVVVVAMRRALADGNLPGALVVNAIGGLLVSPLSWSHHWVWVAPGFVVLVVVALRGRDPSTCAGTALLVLAAFIGPFWFAPQHPAAGPSWTPFQLVYGNTYVLLAVAALLVAALRTGALGTGALGTGTRGRRRNPDPVAVPAGPRGQEGEEQPGEQHGPPPHADDDRLRGEPAGDAGVEAGVQVGVPAEQPDPQRQVGEQVGDDPPRTHPQQYEKRQ